jgi:hypothetical protein
MLRDDLRLLATVVLALAGCQSAPDFADGAALTDAAADATPASDDSAHACVQYPVTGGPLVPIPCGTGMCFQLGEWCDSSGAEPVCRCGMYPQMFGPCDCVHDVGETCGTHWVCG